MEPTDAVNSSFIGITTLHLSGTLSVHHQEFLAIQRHWYIIADLIISILLLVTNGHQICNNVPMPMYGYELLMMGRKAARNM